MSLAKWTHLNANPSHAERFRRYRPETFWTRAQEYCAQRLAKPFFREKTSLRDNDRLN